MSESNAVRITGVKALGEYRLSLHFLKGKTYIVDLRELVHRLKGLRPLRDTALFARVEAGAGGHSIAWPGDIDVGADRLFEIALEQNGRADTVQFLRWRWRHGLSLQATADALGLSRRQVAYYSSGEHKVPHTVLLACKGWEVEQQSVA